MNALNVHHGEDIFRGAQNVQTGLHLSIPVSTTQNDMSIINMIADMCQLDSRVSDALPVPVVTPSITET